MSERADVVIIGGGVTGLSTAFWLARAGMDVLVVEKSIVGWEASGRNGGSISPRGDDRPVVPLASYRPPVRPLPMKVLWPEDEPEEVRQKWAGWFSPWYKVHG